MLLLVATALAGTVTLSGTTVSVDGSPVAGFPAPPKAAAEAGGRLYVLTADGTLETWTVAPPARVAAVPAPDAVGVFASGDTVWVSVQETTAVPVDRFVRTAAPAPAATAGSPTTPSAPAAPGAGHVVTARDGAADVDLGRRAGLRPGVDVRFYGVGADGQESIVATGRVRAADEEHAHIDVSRGGRVAAGDRVELAPGAWRYPVAPERFGGVREVGLVLRPVLALDTLGVALVNDAWFTWTFQSPWYVEARVTPLAFGWSSDGNPITVAGALAGGYDSRYFSVGLGAGWSMYNGDLSVGGLATDYESGGVDLSFTDVDNAFAVVQEARLGARDGLSLHVRNTFLLVPEYSYDYVYDDSGNPEYDDNGYQQVNVTQTGSSFAYGGLAMRLNVPTGARTDLFADFSFGSAGATVVEGGVATWMRGNGDRGSVGLQVGAGYASVSASPGDSYVSLVGPMVSLGGRYRF